MSSTNRSNARQSHIADYYVTPIDKIVEFLNEFDKCDDVFRKDIKILDCCAGGSDSHPMSYPEALKRFGVSSVDTIDIREDSLATTKGNYLDINCKGKYEVIITNPPFNISMDIINKAIEDVSEGGYVIMLLRLNYLEGKGRKEFWDKNMAKYIFVHSKRMSFTDDGKTDSVAYAHYVWKKGENPEFAMVKVID